MIRAWASRQGFRFSALVTTARRSPVSLSHARPTMFTRYSAALAAVLILAACGGGGSSPSTSTPSGSTGPGASPDESDIDPNTAYIGDMIVFALRDQYRAEAECVDFQCSFTLLGETTHFDLDDLDPTGPDIRFSGQPEVTDGISHGLGTLRLDGEVYEVYAGWGTYQAFTEIFASATESGVTIDVMLPLSIGNSDGTNPVAGSATWSGVMVGRRYADTYVGRRVTGSASIVADFTAMDVDVLFSDIVEQGGGALSNLQWDDLPIQSGGFQGGGLYGLFYGPDHEEAGGIFEIDYMSGAFGAVRQ